MTLSFPVAGFSRRGVWYCKNRKELESTTSVGLRKGKYVGMRVYDSSSVQHLIKNATFRCGDGLFGGFNVLGGRKILVDLDVDIGVAHGNDALDALKSDVEKFFGASSHFATSDTLLEERDEWLHLNTCGLLIRAIGQYMNRKSVV